MVLQGQSDHILTDLDDIDLAKAKDRETGLPLKDKRKIDKTWTKPSFTFETANI